MCGNSKLGVAAFNRRLARQQINPADLQTGRWQARAAATMTAISVKRDRIGGI
jgi:hypothetical protein